MNDSNSPLPPLPRLDVRWTRQTRTGVLALLIIHSGLLGTLACWYGPTIDEPAHLAAGYRIWTTGQMDLYTVNPPLVKTVATWPLLFFQPRADWSQVVSAPGNRPEFGVGHTFLEDNPGTWDGMLTLARWACIPLSLVGAWVAFQWAREVFGATSGWIALVLWTFDPNILGNGCLIAPDLAGSSMGLLAGYLFWKWLERPRWGAALLAGLGLGLALLSKATLLVFGPLWVLLWIIHRSLRGTVVPQSWRGECRQLLVVLGLSCYVLNLGYGFAGSCTSLKEFEFVSQTLGGEKRSNQISSNRFRNSVVGEIPVPVPREFLLGLDLQKRDFEIGRWSFLNGQWTWRGQPGFYLAAIALKTPLGYGLLLVIALIAIWRDPSTLRRPTLAIMLPGLAIIGFVSREQGFASFVRYVLPALPFAIVLLAAVGRWVDTGSRVARGTIGVTLAWIVSSSVWCFPYSFSYFNEWAGGSANGHHKLCDSNIDWGQDLYFVRDWLNRHPEARPVTISWNAIIDPKLAGINLPPTPTPAGSSGIPTESLPGTAFEGWHIVCVSALHGPDQRLAYLREFEPVDRVGYAVKVYRLNAEQAQRASTLFTPSLVPSPEP